MNDYLNYFVAACNARVSVALSELALVVPHCRTDQFNLSFLLAVVRLYSSLFSGGTLALLGAL